MGIRSTVAGLARQFADTLGPPSFSNTPYPDGGVAKPNQLTEELGGTGTFNFGGYIRSEDFNPQMDAQTAIKNFDEMRRGDSQVHAALEVVKLPIRTATYEIQPAVPGDPVHERIAEFVKWNLFQRMSTSWDDVVRQSLLMLDFGFMIFEKVWSLEEEGDWAGQVVIHKLAPRPPKTIWQWFTDQDGSLISIKQLAVKAGTYQFLDVPASKLVRFTFQQEGDNFTGISMLRSAFPHWLIKKQLYLIDAIRATRFGVGIPRAKLLEGYHPTAEDRAAIAQMLQGLSSHQHAFLIQPPQMEVDILIPQVRQGGAEIMPSIEHQNEQITRNILAQFLDMGGRASGGSRALGGSAMRFFLNAIESIAGQVCEVVNKQLIKDLVDMNFDCQGKYPTMRSVGIRESDVLALGTACAALMTAGLLTYDEQTENTLRTLLNLPEKDKDASAQEGLTSGDASYEDPNAPLAPATAPTPATPATSATVPAQHAVTAPMAATASTPTAPVAKHSVTASTPAKHKSTKPTPAVYAAIHPPHPSSASSGLAADEEDHPSVPKTTGATAVDINPTYAPGSPEAVVSTTSAGSLRLKDRPYQMPNGQTFWRPPTTLEERVLDLREMPSRLDTARTELEGTLKSVREEQILRIASAVAHGGLKNDVKPPLVGKMASIIKKAMLKASDYGEQTVKRELRRQRMHLSESFALFDEGLHPREPAGTPVGGQFTTSSSLPGLGTVTTSTVGDVFTAHVTSNRVPLTQDMEEMLPVMTAAGAENTPEYQTGKIIEELEKTHSAGNETWLGQVAKMDGDYRGMVDNLMKPGGGFTYDVLTRESPKEGYVFSIGGHEKVFDAPTVNVQNVWDYVKANWDTLSEPGNKLGGWEDKGKVFLDVSRVVGSKDEAMKGAMDHHQLAFFDLKAGETIHTPNGDKWSAARSNLWKEPQKGYTVPHGQYAGPTPGYTTGDLAKLGYDVTALGKARLGERTADAGRYVRAHTASDRAYAIAGRDGQAARGLRGTSGETGIAFATPEEVAAEVAIRREERRKQIDASAELSADATAKRLIMLAKTENLTLRRSDWDDNEVEDALKIFLGELTDGDIKRMASSEINEGFSIGRIGAAEELKDFIKVATYSAILDKNVCEVCEELDGEEFELGSDEYKENMPPNPNCKGGDACRCTYLYEIDPKAMGKGFAESYWEAIT